MKLIFSLLDKSELLQPFVEHYLALGVDTFLAVIYESPDTRVASLKIPNARYLIVDKVSFNGMRDAALHNAMRVCHVSPAEWYAIADLDEFADIHGLSLPEAARLANADGADFVAGEFVDRVTADGSMPSHLDRDLWDQFSWAANLTKVVSRGSTNKVIIARGTVEVTPGHHQASGNPWYLSGQVHHFKWWGDVLERYRSRNATYEADGYAFKNESLRLLKYLSNRSGLDLEHPALEARLWTHAGCDDIGEPDTS